MAEFSLDHPFYALDTRWAAGVSLLDDQRTDSRYDLGEVVDQFADAREASRLSTGAGRAACGTAGRAALSVGLTYEDHAFGAVPGAATAPVLLPSDRTLVYPWIGAEWVEDAFYTARNRDQIEKTEDYSLGWRARAQLGYATESLGSDRNAVMLAGHGDQGTRAVRAAVAVLRRRHARPPGERRDRRRHARPPTRATTSASRRAGCCS